MSSFVNIGVALLLVGLALWTVFARTVFVAIACFIAYGLLLGLVWVRLSGIDVALTEAAIGGGLTGALLIGANARLRRTEAAAQAEACAAPTRAIALLLSVTLSAALVVCVWALPQPAPSLAAEVAADMGATGVGNPITAVLLAFRAMDTLLEAIVLVIAMVGVWSLARDADWGGRPGLRKQVDPNGIFAYFARVLVPVGLVFAIYIFWAGADHPGGKFQAATLLAAMWTLLTMAGLAEPPPTALCGLRFAVVLGPLVFVAIGLAGVPLAGAFLGYPDGFSKPLIVVIEAALLPSLTVILALLLAGPARRGAGS